jgi:hypothetical protein
MKVTVGFAFACLVVSLGLGCGSSSKPPTTKCIHTSECGGLVCSLGYCVSACVTSADCMKGERCIITTFEGTDGGTGTGTACQAPETDHCQYNSQCDSPLLCGVDQQCRNQCLKDLDCPLEQKCTSVSHLCVDPVVDIAVYDPVTNELRPVGDAGLSGQGGQGGQSPVDGGGDGSTDVPQGAGGGGGIVVNTCPSPQTTFGNIAQGDANPLFASSVGARTASRFYVFSGYRGPAPTGVDPDAGPPPTENYIYLQSFDPASGASLGAAAPLVHVEDDQYFYLQSAAVAPTGEIAVIHSTATPADGAQSQIYVSFFNTPVPSDGGAAGALTFVKTVQIESTHIVGTPRVIWSVANGAFVVSWKSATTAWYVHVRKFFPNGSAAGGGTNMVSTPAGLYGTISDGQAATSGAFVGVTYRSMGDDLPWLTILDDQGQQVGTPIMLGMPSVATWASTGGTTHGFLGVWQSGANMYGAFVPITAAGAAVSAATDGGVDAGAAPFSTFTIPTASGIQPHLVSDDTGGPGGLGLLLLEPNGASFTYVNADASKRLEAGTVLTSSNAGNQISLTNYRGSFGVTLFDGVKHSTQMVASGCPQ